MHETTNLHRLVFLATETKIIVPTNMRPFIPLVDILNGVAESGLVGFSQLANTPVEQLHTMYKEGRKYGDADETEYRILLTSIAVSSAVNDLTNQKLNQEEFTKLISSWATFKEPHSALLLTEYKEFTWSDDLTTTDDDFVTVSLSPIQELTRGFYRNSLVLIAAPTGVGKSRYSFALALNLLASGQADEVHYYENEYPLRQMKRMARNAREHHNVDWDKVKVFVGPIDYAECREKYKADPTPRRVVVFDSPDTSVTGGDDARWAFASIYAHMSAMAHDNLCVICTSQLNRQFSTAYGPTSSSLAESSFKERYTSVAYAIWPPEQASANVLHAKVLKAREETNHVAGNLVAFRTDFGKLLTYPISPVDPNSDY